MQSPSSQFADAGIHDCTDVESEDQRGRYSPESSVVSDLDLATVGECACTGHCFKDVTLTN